MSLYSEELCGQKIQHPRNLEFRLSAERPQIAGSQASERDLADPPVLQITRLGWTWLLNNKNMRPQSPVLHLEVFDAWLLSHGPGDFRARAPVQGKRATAGARGQYTTQLKSFEMLLKHVSRTSPPQA